MNHPSIQALIDENQQLQASLEQARRIVDHFMTEPRPSDRELFEAELLRVAQAIGWTEGADNWHTPSDKYFDAVRQFWHDLDESGHR